MPNRWSYRLFKSYQNELRENAGKWFKENGLHVQKRFNFILRDHDDWRHNIILPEVADYIDQVRKKRGSEKKSFPLHQYIHHGLSSQAMLFNLVGPLIIRDDLIALSQSFIDVDINWPKGAVTGSLEIEDRNVFNERQAQPTSLDFAIGTKGEEFSIFIEAKLVEQEFGGCSVFDRGDCDGRNPANDHNLCYLHVFGRKYWNRLEEFGFLKDEVADSPICLLANYYQYFREVLFALSKKGVLVILVDERNPVFKSIGDGPDRGLIPFLSRFLPPEVNNKVKMITIQQVVSAIERTSRHDDWIHSFKNKYGITSVCC